MSKPKITLTTCYSGDWDILEVDGIEFASDHSIREHDWIRLLKEQFDVEVEKILISDEEMEERC